MGEIAVDGFYWTDESWGRALRSRHLEPAAQHFFTSLPLRLRGEHGEEEREWALVAATAGVPPDRLHRLHQVHGRSVVVARGPHLTAAEEDASAECGTCGWPRADIILSDDPSVALAVQVADCVPLLFADRRLAVVGAAHAGWRGTALGVARTTVDALRREFGSDPADLLVAHGPSIGACCYEVGEELVPAFQEGAHGDAVPRWFSRDRQGRLHLDLWAANRDQLLEAGVPETQIHQCELCTSSHPHLFASYRRDGKGTGRIAGVIRARGRR